MATPCRGDCEAGGMIQLVFYCRVRRLAVNPSVGVRRQLPLHKGGPVAGRPYCLCLGSLCLPGKREYDSPGTGLAQRGSTAAPLVAAWRRCHIRGDCKARQMIQLGAVIGTGNTAWPSRHGTGSTAWERRLAVNPSVGVRRQLPLHKGGPVAGRPYCLCLGSLCLPGKREYDSPGTGLAQRGSTAAPLVAAWRRCHIRGDCKARQMIQLGAVIGCGSVVCLPRHWAGGTPPIPQSTFADSSLYTREPSLLLSKQPA